MLVFLNVSDSSESEGGNEETPGEVGHLAVFSI